MNSGRRLATRALVVLASVVVVLALLAGYLRHAVVNADQFANRATAALRDDRIRTLLGDRITDRVLQQEPNLVAARPLIESLAAELVSSRAVTGLFRAAVRDVHRAVFERDRDTVTLTVADIGTVLAAALEQVRPELARELEGTRALDIASRDLGQFAPLVRGIRMLALVLPAVALALVAAALALSRDRRRTTVELGVGVAAGGVAVVVAYALGRSGRSDAFDAVWSAYLGDLRTAAWILAACGAVVAAAAASLLKPVDLGEPLVRAARALRAEPVKPAARVIRALGLIAAGVLMVLARDAVVDLVVTALGLYLVYAGVSVLLRMAYRPEAAMRPQRRMLVPVIPVVLVAGVVALFVGTGGTSTAALSTDRCNGHEALCERPLNRVALASTHNSMSAPLPGWYSSQQDGPIADQLRDGIRGLLIDTHYADRLPSGRLRTDVTDFKNSAREDGVSDEAVGAALRIRDRLGFTGQGERGMYLCHSFCELGGTPLEEVLDDIHDFLVANPDEVLVVINQDYVTPADFVGAVRDAELEPFAYRGSTSRWPTLREMIDSGQRVVFLAENRAGAAPWYHLAYEAITQETPYSFSRVPQLIGAAGLAAGCEPNRGPDGAPIFLLNHWITTDPVPLPSNSTTVNAYDALLGRARECERVRGAFPNLIAVDFYRQGDLLKVVDALNGVG